MPHDRGGPNSVFGALGVWRTLSIQDRWHSSFPRSMRVYDFVLISKLLIMSKREHIKAYQRPHEESHLLSLAPGLHPSASVDLNPDDGVWLIELIQSMRDIKRLQPFSRLLRRQKRIANRIWCSTKSIQGRRVVPHHPRQFGGESSGVATAPKTVGMISWWKPREGSPRGPGKVYNSSSLCTLHISGAPRTA